MYLKNFIRRDLIQSFTTQIMAKSKFEYVKGLEMEQLIFPHNYIVVQIDGKEFHRFAKCHDFVKPNDELALNLMTKAAEQVCKEFNDIFLAYGQSDEYSFIFRKETDIYQRRHSKIMSTVVSTFSSAYVFYWEHVFNHKLLQYSPSFYARICPLPASEIVKDYLMWRQRDCHINNLHNTCFWKLVQDGGLSPKEAQSKLQRMGASEKNELLFSEFQTNYNNLPPLFRKGTVIVKELVKETSQISEEASEASTIRKCPPENIDTYKNDCSVPKKKKVPTATLR